MKTPPEHNARVANMTVSTVYPLYVTKIERKGRTKAELNQVIEWLTGYNKDDIQKFIDSDTTFEKFFETATINPKAHLITGTICGYRVEEIDNTLTQKVRYLDKLVDELARGRAMEKILRT
jgi:hypothetical protein